MVTFVSRAITEQFILAASPTEWLLEEAVEA